MALAFDGGPSTEVSLFVYGDVVAATHVCLVRDTAFASNVNSICALRSSLEAKGVDLSKVPATVKPWPISLGSPAQDALIERSRALVAKQFLAEPSKPEVLVMLDHDLEWLGPSEGYEGDICHLARRCADTGGIVGGAVSKRVQGQGVAIIWKKEGEHDLGSNELAEVHCVGAAFTAYHRDVLQAVTDTMEEVPPGYSPIFDCMVVEHPKMEKRDGSMHPPGDQKLALSEDWAFCMRASALGFPVHVALRPIIRHWGLYPYSVRRDAFKLDRADFLAKKIAKLERKGGEDELVEKLMKLYLQMEKRTKANDAEADAELKKILDNKENEVK